MPSLTHPDTTVAPSSAERPFPSRRSKHPPRPHGVQGSWSIGGGYVAQWGLADSDDERPMPRSEK